MTVQRPKSQQPPLLLTDDGLSPLLPKLMSGLAASGTFLVLFFVLYSRGVPPLDSFIMVLLGAGFMGVLGFQLGKVLASVAPRMGAAANNKPKPSTTPPDTRDDEVDEDLLLSALSDDTADTQASAATTP
jgi:hypothetical protein